MWGWSNGSLNTNAACYADYLLLKECITELQAAADPQGVSANEEVYDCLRRRGLYEGQTLEVDPDAIAECDLGMDCHTDTGCYWNAKSLISWRSSQRSVMSHDYVSSYFNKVSQDAILQKINQMSR